MDSEVEVAVEVGGAAAVPEVARDSGSDSKAPQVSASSTPPHWHASSPSGSPSSSRSGEITSRHDGKDIDVLFVGTSLNSRACYILVLELNL